jgi:tetratricopeptide (TPR) repeat protein
LTRSLDFADVGAATDAARQALAAGDVAAAERICKQIMSVAREHGPVWALLTETALLRNRPDAAIVCAERAVALMPDDAIAHALRAKCLLMSGEIGPALAATEAAERVVGTAPEALDAVGAMFGLIGRHAQAGALFRRAVAARPDVAQYRFNLAATERMTGALADAEAHCDAAVACDPRYCVAHYLRSDLRIQTAERNHVAEMERLLAAADLPWSDEVLLRYALGKECEDLGEHARAFAHVAAGADLQRRSIAYDPRADIAEVDGIIATQTRAWLATLPPGCGDVAPVFVVGLPRTGTTLVERMIAGHGTMTSIGEAGAFAVALHRAMRSGGRADFAQLGRHYLDQVAAFGPPRGRRFVDKTLKNYLLCGLIHAALPHAKIVLVRRHPLDAGWAIYKAHFRGGFAFSYEQGELADYILAFRRLAAHWRATLPPQAYMEVGYEDVVRDFSATARRLISFVGLPWEEGILRFHESPAPSATASAVQIRRPLYSSSVGKWRVHAERLARLRTRLAAEIPAAELE